MEYEVDCQCQMEEILFQLLAAECVAAHLRKYYNITTDFQYHQPWDTSLGRISLAAHRKLYLISRRESYGIRPGDDVWLVYTDQANSAVLLSFLPLLCLWSFELRGIG